MKNFGSAQITNALLLIIAVLLMIQIGNNSSPRGYKAPHGDLSEMGGAPEPSATFNPHAEDGHNHEMDAGPAAGLAEAQKQGFNFQNMVFAALRCPSDGTITLADVGCKDKEADERRKFVNAMDANLPPRMMFDKIIEKFGEKALSDEALEIRKNNRR